MRTGHLLTTMGLLLTLSACVTPSISPSADDSQNTSSQNTSSQSDSSSLSTETSAAAPCELAPEAKPEPLATAENTPVFEQFNFQPQEISVAGDAVTFTSAHYIFSLCKTNSVWSIVSAEASEDEDTDYEQAITDIKDPDYETIELGDESYQYRVRLQAQWLDDRIESDAADAEATSTAPEDAAAETEDTVFFELKKPDGSLITQPLYTLSQLQEAQLGASLGAPSIADALSIENELWFAASATQGEGDSGFASLVRYSPETDELVIEQPEAIQGDQITSMVATLPTETDSAKTDSAKTDSAKTDSAKTNQSIGEAESTRTENENSAENEPDSAETPALTLWLGTQRSGEGVPYYPASGLVAYQPERETLSTYTITNSPLIGAIPHQLAIADDTLWIGTGEGACQVNWQTIKDSSSWNCWQFTAIAQLPSEGVELFDSFLAGEPAATLKKNEVEVLWVGQQFEEGSPDSTSSDSASSGTAKPKMTRYEVVYEPGFEVELAQGGYRVANEAAQRAAGGNKIFWPGNQWHWGGDRFKRSLDEVALNFFGGGPRGLMNAESSSGFNLDSYAVRGEFDLLALTDDSTKVHYYSGWIDSTGIDVYPTVIPAEMPTASKPNPLTKMAADLSKTQGP